MKGPVIFAWELVAFVSGFILAVVAALALGWNPYAVWFGAWMIGHLYIVHRIARSESGRRGR